MRLLFLYLSLTFTFQHLQAQSTISYFDNMIKSISSIDALEYELHAKELIDGRIFYTHSRVKLQKDPFCFYNYIIKPHDEIPSVETNNYYNHQPIRYCKGIFLYWCPKSQVDLPKMKSFGFGKFGKCRNFFNFWSYTKMFGAK